MSSTSKPSQQTQNSSYFTSQETTRSILVTKVSLALDENDILRSLAHDNLSIEKVSRRYDPDRQPIPVIRVDFKSDNEAMLFINRRYIFINGVKYPARGYWPLICRRCQNEGHFASQCPKQALTEERLIELFTIQQEQLESMMNSFEAKWNARLSQLKTSSTNSNMEQLVPIFKDLNTVCQQFFQQNGQTQQQLGSIVSRVQGVQTKSNNQ
ncbi:unnamed protein product [Rotaria magnacalcarata]|uniref:CCHC-type domain-containing protein n=1 Tax=Rotaria magnacalcarata TaxID=392030 RepID=A0A816SDN5_9BILA|nr:unnamed protein product [Rotaria magnacalcarata]CAF2113210.1 unnamed protein product [Rotaria magnacalcarata]CAF3975445.1 unnamed protein product [Rotaria magnacalcarata]CAF4027337.1 unnamed protein product [Rotaria magnacalcarata]